MIRLRPYKLGDLKAIEGRAYEKELVRLTGRDYGEEFAANGPAYTILDDFAPVAAGGVFILWPGVGEAWMHLSDWIYQHPCTLYRETRKMLTAIIHNNGLRRVQAPICRKMQMNRRFVESLGFAPEGTMHRWGPDDEAYVMYARVAIPGEHLALFD